MKKSITLIATLFLSFSFLQAQEGRIKRADKKHDRLAYAEAIDYYKSILAQGVDSSLVAANMANSYYQLRDPKNAAEWYGVVINNNPAPEDYLKYAEMLKGIGEYEKAAKYMIKYNGLDASDSRAAAHVADVNYFVKLSEETGKFKLRNENSNTPSADFSPMYYGDQVIFVSNRNLIGDAVKRQHKWTNEAFLNLFTANVGDEGVLQDITPFSEEVNTKYHEGPVAFNYDFSQVFFTRNNFLNGKKKKSSDDIVKLKIYISDLTINGWGEPKDFPYNSDEYSVGHPTLSIDGNTMYFSSDMPGGYGGTDLWKTTLVNDEWSKPTNMGARINSEGNEMFPYLHTDGTLYYSSDGLLGLGGLDVFECQTSTEGFNSPENLGAPLNSNRDDFGFILNSEKTEGYVSSNRENGQGNDDIYHFLMDSFKPLTISGIVVNAEDDMNPLEGARVRLLDAYDVLVEEKTMDSDGKFKFTLDPEHCGYKIQAENGEDWSDYAYDNAPCDKGNGDISLGEIPLKQPNWSARGIVKNKRDLSPIPGFVITLTNLNTGEEAQKITGVDGIVNYGLEGNTDYEMKFQKNDFFAKTGYFSTLEMEPGVVELERYIDLSFEEIEIGKAITIENINYDYDKSFIRPDAAIELDKIVTLLIDNPEIKIEMGSHTDARGSDAYNLKLSQRRAKSAMEYIISQGIEKDRMYWRGYGEVALVNNCSNGVQCSDEEHEINRRTEFKVVGFVKDLTRASAEH